MSADSMLNTCLSATPGVEVTDSNIIRIGIGPISTRRRRRRIDIGLISIRVALLSGLILVHAHMSVVLRGQHGIFRDDEI